jgi:hypothetical protein
LNAKKELLKNGTKAITVKTTIILFKNFCFLLLMKAKTPTIEKSGKYPEREVHFIPASGKKFVLDGRSGGKKKL